ncbi:OsmC family protein [Nitratireductor luteus]|uniref:OsmC family protein n=1 Tax=Nitratireductor luteus TaxID=2976980 RepID=UPI0022405460|nr:OsmC family protein [Nitratireductor luteus]
MDAVGLKEVQAPLKQVYREAPEKALITLRARGALDDSEIACRVETGRMLAVAGLHPATGGSGMELCSGDMLLEALVACAGVTMKAVATALEFRLGAATIEAEGDLDFRGTLGLAKDAPVGFCAIRLTCNLDTDEPQERIDALLKLTERYCVVFQTLNSRPELTVTGHA